MYPAMVAASDIPSGWLQMGLGGAALFILYVVLKPLVKSQTDSNKRVVQSMEYLARSQAVSTEIQRNLLTHAQRSAAADAALAQAIRDLQDRVSDAAGPRR